MSEQSKSLGGKLITVGATLIFGGLVLTFIPTSFYADAKKELANKNLLRHSYEYSLKKAGYNPTEVVDWRETRDVLPKGGDGIKDFEIFTPDPFSFGKIYSWKTIRGYNHDSSN